MGVTWAVARQMIAECLRMKLALVFLVLLGLILIGLPFSIEGDSSLTGAVQSFLSYSLNATGFLLGILTIFLSRSLSDEMVNRQILLIMAKPVPRWQFVLGKWLGITGLNFVFLAFTGLAIYGMVHLIVATKPPINEKYDAEELREGVLVARHAVQFDLPDFRKIANAELEQRLEQGLYDQVVDFNRDLELARLTVKAEARWRVVGPLDGRVFTFHNILCDRSQDASIQLRYKTQVTQYAPDELFRAVWRFGDPSKNTGLYERPVRQVVDRFHTIRVPADCVAPDGTLRVEFFNVNPFQGEPQFYNVIEFQASDGVEVLFTVGSFGWNLVRLLVLFMCKLMFLAAVALLATTAFSFPVACLFSFTVYVLAGTRNFLEDALDFASADWATWFTSVQEFFAHLVSFVYTGTTYLVPNFGRYNAIEDLVNGRNVSLAWVLQGVGDLLLLRTVLVLGLAMLLFHRREVSELSV